MDLSAIGTVIGAALMIGSPAHWIWWRRQVARHCTLVKGVVVRMEPLRPEAEAEGVYHPVIRIRRSDGEAVQFTSLFGASPSLWSVGDTLTGRVSGDVIRHDSFGIAFLDSMALFAFGTLMLITS